MSTIYDLWPFELREAAARAVNEALPMPFTVTAASLAHISAVRVRRAVVRVADSHSQAIDSDFRSRCCRVATILGADVRPRLEY